MLMYQQFEEKHWLDSFSLFEMTLFHVHSYIFINVTMCQIQMI